MRILTRITASSGLDVSSAGVDTITLGNSSTDKVVANAPITASAGINTTIISASTLYVDNPLITFNTAQFQTLNVLNDSALSGTTYLTGTAYYNGLNLATASYALYANDGPFAKLSTANTFTQTQTVSGNIYVTNAISSSNLTSSAITASQIKTDYVDFATNLTANPTHQQGRIFWDSANDTLALYNNTNTITQQLGQEFFLRAVNKSGATILNGTAVRVSGSTGDRLQIWPAVAIDQTEQSNRIYQNEIIGVATHDIIDNATGSVTVFGIVNDLNTYAFNAGDVLYVSQSAGLYTNNAPQAPYDQTVIGYVARKSSSPSATNGSIFVYTKGPNHFHDISSVSASTYQQGDIWVYQSASSGDQKFWTNTKQLSSSVGYGITGSLSVTSNLSALTIAGSTVTGSTATFTTISGSSISGTSITGPLLGTLNGVSVLNAGTNLTATTIATVRTLSLTSSITSGLTTISGATNISSTNGNFVNLTGSSITSSLLQIPLAAVVSGYNATANKIAFNNNNSQIFDDGNLHIHGSGSVWLNSANNSDIQLNIQTSGSVRAANDFYMNSGYGSVAQAFGVRAWVNFDGTGATGTQTKRGSGNIGTVTKNSTGNYTINFTNAMPDANYCVQAICRNDLGTDADLSINIHSGTIPSTSAFTIQTARYGNGPADSAYIMVSVIR